MQELFRRLKQGISLEESSLLLEKVEREEALERAPKENPFRFKDRNAQRLSDLWFSQRKTASTDQKDKVGLAYISDVLGLGEEIARGFAEGDERAFHAVGMKQAAIHPADTSKFWEKVRQIFPEIYAEEDIKFLIRDGNIGAVLHFLWQIEVPLAEESSVLHQLSINAHAYK